MNGNVNIFSYETASRNACLIRNSTKLITNLYEGIPETLILNVLAWIVLVLLFTILRQQAWDYGRLALMHATGDNRRWTQLFYANSCESETPEVPQRNGNGTPTSTNQPHFDRGFLSWIPITLRLKTDQILRHSGPDAVHYLSFQQHLMMVMAIITVISIVIILPVNFQGTLSGDVNSFGHTTISNLAPDSPLLWIHVIVAICYAPLIVLVMRRSSGRNAFKTAATRTIMATNISQADCSSTTITTYIQELFPDVRVEDVQLAYNIGRLTEVAEEYERILEARIYCDAHKSRAPVRAAPHWYSCKTVDGLEYYQDREMRLQGEVARLRASALNEPLGIAFITVNTTQAAQQIIMHFRPGTYREWTLTYAPAPSDIFWEHLSVSSSRWYLKWALVNIILFLFLFFLTTPVLIVNMLDTLQATNTISKVSPLISEFLPTLLLWTLAALMPVIVAYSDKWLQHWTRSKQNYSIMTKSFGYLLFMILILPSMGLTSAQALVEWTFRYSDEEAFRWECIFLPDKGAFFVNYVITAAFIGTALELIRFPELIVYVWKLLTAKSSAETPYIRKQILIEFPFGIHYAWTLTVFTISVVYSVACPLIMPFAMVYLCFKHFGDRHNLYFAYGPSNMISQGGGRIHSTAVTMTKFSVILLLIILAALATVRGRGLDARAIVLMLSLCCILTLFTFMSPIKKCTTKRPSIQEIHGPAPLYVADVLLKRHLNTIPPAAVNYGSDSPTVTEAINTEIVPIRNNSQDVEV